MPLLKAGSYNIHSLTVHEVPLCVRCSVCRRRATIKADAIKQRRSMDTLGSLRLRCTDCGSGKVERWMPTRRHEAEAFLAGALDPDNGAAS